MGCYRYELHAGELFYNYFRDYDPSIGRYIESDPIGLQGGINTYAYVFNNPFSHIDPQGLVAIHGNWCGPDWTGGYEGSYTPHRASTFKDPTDKLDAACQIHDVCYYQCRQDNPCDKGQRGACFLKCDSVLGSAAFGDRSVAGTAVGAAMNRPGDRKEENKTECGCSEDHPLHNVKIE